MSLTTDERRKILDNTREVTPEVGRWAVLFEEVGKIAGYGRIAEVGETTVIVQDLGAISFAWFIDSIEVFETEGEAESRFKGIPETGG